jgi:hypothetical protein
MAVVVEISKIRANASAFFSMEHPPFDYLSELTACSWRKQRAMQIRHIPARHAKGRSGNLPDDDARYETDLPH